MMRNIKLTLEYDGANFFGFQRQPHHPTIQEALEKALSKFFDRKIKISAASGRTDTGVHAAGQVVNFKTDSDRELAKIQNGLNALLPPQIAVKAIQKVPLKFHARYSAKLKTYEYQIWNHPVRSPLHRVRACHIPHPLNSRKMRQAAKMLIGSHDFRSFCAANRALRLESKEKNTVRTIKRFEIKRTGSLIVIRVEANGFLYHMVRNLVGTLIELGAEKIGLSDVQKILKARNRTAAPQTAPAAGLTLLSVTY